MPFAFSALSFPLRCRLNNRAKLLLFSRGHSGLASRGFPESPFDETDICGAETNGREPAKRRFPGKSLALLAVGELFDQEAAARTASQNAVSFSMAVAREVSGLLPYRHSIILPVSVRKSPRNPARAILIFVVIPTTHKTVRSCPRRSLDGAIRLAERFMAGVTKPTKPVAEPDSRHCLLVFEPGRSLAEPRHSPVLALEMPL